VEVVVGRLGRERPEGAERHIPRGRVQEEWTESRRPPRLFRELTRGVTLQRVDEVRARRPILERVLRGVEQRRFPDDGAVVAARELRLLPVGIVGGIAKE